MVYRIRGQYYVPGNAKEVRTWLRDYWTRNEIPLPKDFSSMKAKQLYAIYHNIRGGGKPKSTQSVEAVTKEIREEREKSEKGKPKTLEAQLSLFS